MHIETGVLCGSGRRFKRCCRNSGRYDGSLRDHYF
ncbi:MAG: SEC-C metal-binding domain-containing protein [Leptolyngbyaceae cyanobacterium]